MAPRPQLDSHFHSISRAFQPHFICIYISISFAFPPHFNFKTAPPPRTLSLGYKPQPSTFSLYTSGTKQAFPHVPFSRFFSSPIHINSLYLCMYSYNFAFSLHSFFVAPDLLRWRSVSLLHMFFISFTSIGILIELVVWSVCRSSAKTSIFGFLGELLSFCTFFLSFFFFFFSMFSWATVWVVVDSDLNWSAFIRSRYFCWFHVKTIFFEWVRFVY